jgi:hypothetical protein
MCSFGLTHWPAGVWQFLPVGNSAVKTEILSPETGNPSLPRRCLAAIVLAYYMEEDVWVKARSGRIQVKVQGRSVGSSAGRGSKCPNLAADGLREFWLPSNRLCLRRHNNLAQSRGILNETVSYTN